MTAKRRRLHEFLFVNEKMGPPPERVRERYGSAALFPTLTLDLIEFMKRPYTLR